LFIFDPEEDPGVVGVLDDGVEHPGGGSVTSRCKRAPYEQEEVCKGGYKTEVLFGSHK
jgi:hypothetical protein